MSDVREQWSSRPAFLLAAIGAAVGFGNIWRFPALAYKYGGGAFFIPYLLALFFVGIPLLLLEIALGQHLSTGDVGVFGSISPRLRGVGLISVLCGFIVTGYYVPLLAWISREFFESFGHVDWENVAGADASDYFFNDIVGMGTLDDSLRPTRIVWENLFYLFFSWICIGGCVAFGIKWTGRIAYFTMGFPIFLLFVFFGRAVTLEGAEEGINAYIGQWDMAVLRDKPEVWSTAVSQIFFSLGTTFGVMTAFGSHCPLNAPATENTLIIAFSNSFFSFIAGFAVFGSLGYLKNYEGADNLEDVVASGPALMFGTYPAVLSTLPGGSHWVRLLFFNLFLLGIDSAFALTEAVLTVLKDSVAGSSLQDKVIVWTTVSAGFIMGIMYTDS
jgi:SNF family Na+-dependent transporter